MDKNKNHKDEKMEFKLNTKTLIKIVPFLLIFLLMFFTFSLRSAPINLDGTKNLIEQNIINQVQNSIKLDIDGQYPNLNVLYKQELIDKEIAKFQNARQYKFSNGEIINLDETITSSAKYIK